MRTGCCATFYCSVKYKLPPTFNCKYFLQCTKKISEIFTIFCLFAGTVNAGLIGDTVHVAHNWSSLGSEIYSPMDVLVENGSGDLANVSPHYSVDIDDTSVFVDFSSTTSWNTGAFNGLVISDIDSLLSDFSVSTNFVG